MIDDLGIGYAPGACLRAHLAQLGYSPAEMNQAGLIHGSGRDVFYRRVVFCWDTQIYGRSIGSGARHLFLRGSKGGLYDWGRLQHARSVILVEGLFDVAALWQAGFRQTTCAFGARLNRLQLEQLLRGERQLWIAFDGDIAGDRAAAELARQLPSVRRLRWPAGHDPASYFHAGAGREQFQQLLDEAR